MRVCVIGLGEIGTETYLAMVDGFNKKGENSLEILYGVDVAKNRIADFNKMGFRASSKVPSDYNIYIISVYTPKQIQGVISKINLKNNPLIVIESTMLPGDSKIILEKYPEIDLVLFPHRYNPNDKEHHVFNLNRIIGAVSKKAMARARDFYSKFMSDELITEVSLQIAELSKPLENAYRYIEIAIAEEVKMECDRLGINFNDLRNAVNTKWNIDLKEARTGVGLKCLPKDCKFINKFFNKNTIFKTALDIDKKYREDLKSKGKKASDYREID